MASFIGHHPVSVAFDSESPCCYVTSALAEMLGHLVPLADSRFRDVLTASYHGRALTTDVEFEIASSLDCDVLIGMNWISVWRTVGREDLNPVHNPYSSLSCVFQGDCILL
ncbi:hypothetical protein BDR06DRAFT_945803 [Suillus hirtellus]|nr:hypothetical protein BDR06DRAFT_945803 [Suillus hirtellus]